MFRLFLFVSVLFLYFGNALAKSKADTLKDNISLAQKLEDIVAPILVGNPQLCGTYKTAYIGAEFMTRSGVGESYKELVTEHFGVGEYPTVTIIGKGSPADGALKKGDVIKGINGQSLATGNEGQYALEDTIAEGNSITLNVTRNGLEQNVNLKPAKVCGAKVRLATQDDNKIWAEKGKVFVSRGALRTLSESQLAQDIKTQLARYKK